jgi:hypothetical protein
MTVPLGARKGEEENELRVGRNEISLAQPKRCKIREQLNEVSI